MVPLRANGVGHPLPRSGAPRVVLGSIVFGILGFASYCVVGRMSELADPAMSLHGTQKLVMPWDDESLHDTGGSVAKFAYRYRNSEGHMEDAPPVNNKFVYKVDKNGKVIGGESRRHV
ncbi:hypothetical protein BDY24DRAFT_382931 [Mrakia frigida]|uniref:uncharacterized protein n=1 Tax=Mrakia frigida TaxID=29902 RepID=UPI003FCC097F